MRSLRLRLRPGDLTIDPMVDLYLQAPYLDAVRLHHWNLQREGATFMHSIEGDPERFRDALAESDLVTEFELLPVGERSAYVYMLAEPSETAWLLFDAFTETGLLTVPPVRFADGQITMRVVGEQETLQGVLEAIPDAIETEIDRLGEFAGDRPSPLAALTDRQQEALEAGLAVGYYDVPRSASHEAVAEVLGCSPSTSAEHLQKAEARLVEAVLQRG